MSRSLNVAQSQLPVGLEHDPVATPRPCRTRGGVARSPFCVASLVLLLYLLWCVTALYRFGENPVLFAMIAPTFIEDSHASPLIDASAIKYHKYLVPGGYDGESFFAIALDPQNARYYFRGDGAYRYARIVYPLTARLLMLGNVDLLPYTLIIVNWLAIAGGTLAVAAWLKRRGYSPWFALIYGLYPGLFVSLQRDLCEPLAYALAALGVYLVEYGGRRRYLWAGLSFALAILTRETTGIFALILGVTALVQAHGDRVRGWRIATQWRGPLLFLALSFVPYIAYKIFLRLWLGDVGLPRTVLPDPIPFHGLFAYWPWPFAQQECIRSGVAPALICLGAAVWGLFRRPACRELWMLVANALILVVFLPAASYDGYGSMGRIITGVVLAALYCLPVLDHLTKHKRGWLLSASLLWLLPVPFSLFLPIAVGF